jgi:hypothetical protein
MTDGHKSAPLLYSVKATAAALSLGQSTVWALIKAGRLKAVKIWPRHAYSARRAGASRGGERMTLAEKEVAPRCRPQAPLKGHPRRTSDTTNLAPIRDDDKVWEITFTSWARVIQQAPIENRPRLLFMMSRDAAAWAAACRQQAIDDAYQFAVDLGLVRLLGDATVQNILTAAFDRGAA